ncbi:MAG TPA: hypothetical protein VHQ21_09180, partial [Rhodanobacteraceae bacterium]|nr:hypothetical protein [Rhodanobacteraceae bacterium]
MPIKPTPPPLWVNTFDQTAATIPPGATLSHAPTGGGSAPGTGTVTSVAVTSADGSITVTGSPITTSGTIDLSAHPGMSAGTLWRYRAKTTATSGYPGDGYILWDNATQTSATHLLFAHLTDDNLDIDLLLSQVTTGQKLILQDANDSANYQEWTLTGAGVNTNGGTATSYW